MADLDWEELFNPEDVDRLRRQSAVATAETRQHRTVSTPILWPPHRGTRVMVENRGQRPVVHQWQMRIEGVMVAACGISPASTEWLIEQLNIDGLVPCKHCWDVE